MHFNPDDDDLDYDDQAKQQSTGMGAIPKINKNTKTPRTPKTTKSLKKHKMSVAHRITTWSSPMYWTRPQGHLYLATIFQMLTKDRHKQTSKLHSKC